MCVFCLLALKGIYSFLVLKEISVWVTKVTTE